MSTSFIIKQWGCTILLGSLLCILLMLIESGRFSVAFDELSSLYLIFVLISFLYSIPTYVVFILVFYFLERSEIKMIKKKFFLLTIAQAGIWISFYSISEGFYKELLLLALGYGIASLGAGIFFSLSLKPSSLHLSVKKNKP